MIGVGSDSQDIVIDETTNYVVCFDPLDGSSNVDAGIPTGTIIGKKKGNLFDEAYRPRTKKLFIAGTLTVLLSKYRYL